MKIIYYNRISLHMNTFKILMLQNTFSWNNRSVGKCQLDMMAVYRQTYSAGLTIRWNRRMGGIVRSLESPNRWNRRSSWQRLNDCPEISVSSRGVPTVPAAPAATVRWCWVLYLVTLPPRWTEWCRYRRSTCCRAAFPRSWSDSRLRLWRRKERKRRARSRPFSPSFQRSFRRVRSQNAFRGGRWDR